MDEDEETPTKNKIYKSAAFLGHLLCVGRSNIARTPVVLKAGILLLNIAFILYLTGFVSPHWVQGKKHKYRHDARGNRLAEDSNSSGDGNSSFAQENDTHFGVWEECMVMDGESVCTIFTEDIESVILMFGCVGGFILFGLCCWACFSCVRKPKKVRYFFIVISAIIGGMFGAVSIIIFIAVQGIKLYSWAFGLFLCGCTLELSAAAVFMWGIRQAIAQGIFLDTVPEDMDMEDTATRTVPTIVVTPARKDQRRSVHVIDNAPRAKAGGGGGGSRQDEDHMDFISLDMMSPVPRMSRTGKQKKRRRRKNRNTGASPSGVVDETPVNALARRVAEHHLCYMDLVGPTPSPRSPADTKPNVPSTDTSQPLIRAMSPSASDMDLNERPASVYLDLTKVLSKHRHCEDSERHRRGSLELRVPQRSAFRQLDDKPRRPPYGPIRLKVDVHQPDTFDDLFQANRREDFTSEHPARSSPTAFQMLPCSQPQSTPPIPSHRSLLDRALEARPESGEEPQQLFPGSKDPEIADMAFEGCGGARTKESSRDEAQDIKYSPDTYYQTRSSFYSFKWESSSSS